MPSFSLWPVALVLAAAAPWAARAFEVWLLGRVRRRTLALLAEALPQRQRQAREGEDEMDAARLDAARGDATEERGGSGKP
jgi:hypothetical protein